MLAEVASAYSVWIVIWTKLKTTVVGKKSPVMDTRNSLLDNNGLIIPIQQYHTL